MGFVATCIEEVAANLALNYQEVINQFERHGIIYKYIVKHYETLHSEKRKNIVQDLIEILKI